MFIQNGWTALHCAAAGGHPDVVDLILNNNPGMITQTDKVSQQIIQLLYS